MYRCTVGYMNLQYNIYVYVQVYWRVQYIYIYMYRCNLAGGDLNRQYKNVVKDAFPTVFHTKELILKILGWYNVH